MKSNANALLFLALLQTVGAVSCSDAAKPVMQSKDGRWRVVHIAEAMWKEDRARQEMESALERFGQIDLVFAHNDDMAHGAFVASQHKGRDGIKFVGIDALPQVGRRYLANKQLSATIEYSTCAMEAIDLALLLCNGVQLNEQVRDLKLGTRTWTRQNLARGGDGRVSPDQIALDTLRRQHAKILTTQPATDEIFRVGMAQCTDDEPWRTAMREDLIAAAGRYPQIEFDYRSADDDNEKQRSIVRDFVAQGYHAILLSPKETLALAAPCKEALARGVHVVVIDRELGTDDYSVFIGDDNLLIGNAAGMEIEKLLPDGGTIVEIQGLMTSSPARERHDGFVEALGLESMR